MQLQLRTILRSSPPQYAPPFPPPHTLPAAGWEVGHGVSPENPKKFFSSEQASVIQVITWNFKRELQRPGCRSLGAVPLQS